jgi:hypothetical protein
MKICHLIVTLGLQLLALSCFCQANPPWNNPLKIAWSSDGITFNAPVVFQDSSGVPSVIKWKGDTLIATFQWFRQPKLSPTWDRVAVKFSYDNGRNWSQPKPIFVNGLPSNYQRPFDPTLTVFGNDSIRIYFSSSNGIPKNGLDATVNTYSAKSSDGINFNFESGSRVDELTKQVIDPAIIFFNKSWHFLSPIGSPQQGAYHYLSLDGLNFTPTSNIPSDNFHNWTGNFMIENINELRFYGSGATIWYNYSTNGNNWSGYVSTNIQGGDPSVLKIKNNSYLMVYVGQPYPSNILEIASELKPIQIFPNPTQDLIHVRVDSKNLGSMYVIYDYSGKTVLNGKISSESMAIELADLPYGNYVLTLTSQTDGQVSVVKISKQGR